jgi:hypothetical protein
VSTVELTDGKGRGKEWRRSPVIRRRESLVLYKSFNTLFLTVKALRDKREEGPRIKPAW